MSDQLIFKKRGDWTDDHVGHLMLLFLLEEANPDCQEKFKEDRDHMDSVMKNYFPEWWKNIKTEPKSHLSRRHFRQYAKEFLAAMEKVGGNDFSKTLGLNSGPTWPLCVLIDLLFRLFVLSERMTYRQQVDAIMRAIKGKPNDNKGEATGPFELFDNPSLATPKNAPHNDTVFSPTISDVSDDGDDEDDGTLDTASWSQVQDVSQGRRNIIVADEEVSVWTTCGETVDTHRIQAVRAVLGRTARPPQPSRGPSQAVGLDSPMASAVAAREVTLDGESAADSSPQQEQRVDAFSEQVTVAQLAADVAEMKAGQAELIVGQTRMAADVTEVKGLLKVACAFFRK